MRLHPQTGICEQERRASSITSWFGAESNLECDAETGLRLFYPHCDHGGIGEIPTFQVPDE